MSIETGICNTCGNERYDEDFGCCALELNCEDCMDRAGICYNCPRAMECRDLLKEN